MPDKSREKAATKAITSFNWSNYRLDDVGEIAPENADYAAALAKRVIKAVDKLGAVEWKPYDREDKANTTPTDYELVWIVEEFYAEGGVEIGYFDGFTFCTAAGSDDCSVSWWAPINYPKPPKRAKEGDDSAEDGQSPPSGESNSPVTSGEV